MARIKKILKEGFTTVSNDFLKDPELGMKERGLLITMLSLPDNWEFSAAGLSKILPNGINGVNSVLQNLERHGYLQRNAIRDNKGLIIDREYVFSDSKLSKKPENNPYHHFSDMDNRDMDNPYMDNEAQLNTNISNTKEYDDDTKKAAEHVEEILINSNESKRYQEANDYETFPKAIQKITSLVEKLPKNQILKIRSLNEENLIHIFNAIQETENDDLNKFNNPDGYIVSVIQKQLN